MLFEMGPKIYTPITSITTLPRHLLGGNVDTEMVHVHILKDDKLLSDWHGLLSQLPREKASTHRK